MFIATELGRQGMIWTSDLQDRILADTVEHSGAISEGITAVNTLPIEQFSRSGPQ